MVRQLRAGLPHITGVTLEETENGLTAARVTTDTEDIYQLTRKIFLAFVGIGAMLYNIQVR